MPTVVAPPPLMNRNGTALVKVKSGVTPPGSEARLGVPIKNVLFTVFAVGRLVGKLKLCVPSGLVQVMTWVARKYSEAIVVFSLTYCTEPSALE